LKGQNVYNNHNESPLSPGEEDILESGKKFIIVIVIC